MSLRGKKKRPDNKGGKDQIRGKGKEVDCKMKEEQEE